MVVTTITHESGEWIRGYLPVRPTKNDPQALGSAITYGKRYGLQALSGQPSEDDDGNKASEKRDESDYIDDLVELRKRKGMNAAQLSDMVDYYCSVKKIKGVGVKQYPDLINKFDAVYEAWQGAQQ